MIEDHKQHSFTVHDDDALNQVTRRGCLSERRVCDRRVVFGFGDSWAEMRGWCSEPPGLSHQELKSVTRRTARRSWSGGWPA